MEDANMNTKNDLLHMPNGFARHMEQQERLVRHHGAKLGYRLRIPRTTGCRLYQLIHRETGTVLLEADSLESVFAFIEREAGAAPDLEKTLDQLGLSDEQREQTKRKLAEMFTGIFSVQPPTLGIRASRKSDLSIKIHRSDEGG
jgi:hypothetical protein